MEMLKLAKRMHAKRIMALLTAFVMVFTVSMPAHVFADNYEDSIGVVSESDYVGGSAGVSDPYDGSGENDGGTYNDGYGGYNDGYGDGYGDGNDGYGDGNDGYGDGNDYKCEYECVCEYKYEEEDEEELQLIAPFGAGDLSALVNVTNWNLRTNQGVSIFDNSWNLLNPPGVPFGTDFRFYFDWEINLSSDGPPLQGGETFSIARPTTSGLGSFSFPNSAWLNFSNLQGVVLGQWRMHNNYFEVVLNNNVAGNYSINGTFTTGVDAVRSNVAVESIQYIYFNSVRGPSSVHFRQRARTLLQNVQGKSATRQSGSDILWQLNLHNIGPRELTGKLGGNAWGTHFTPVQGFFVEDALNGEFLSLDVRFPVMVPMSLTCGFAATNGAMAPTANPFLTRVSPNPGESRAAFRARLQPFQWGIWEDPNNTMPFNPGRPRQIFIAYFGTLGQDGPTISQVNGAGFAAVAADNVINDGFFDVQYRNALIDYFTAVYGDGNVIGGRVPNIRLEIWERIPHVAQTTVITNRMDVTRNGVTTPTNANVNVQPQGGIAQLQPQTARVLLTERTGTPDMGMAIQGAQFELQRLDGGIWSTFTDSNGNSVFTTDVTGRTPLTAILPTGTYRFVQIGNGSNSGILFDRTISPNSPYFNAMMGTVVAPGVAQQFNIVSGVTQGQEFHVRNVRNPSFVVNYVAIGSMPPSVPQWSGPTPDPWAPPASQSFQVGAVVNIAPNPQNVPNQRQNWQSGTGLLGTFVWDSGWDVPAGINVTGSGNNRSFIMPAQNVTIEGEWKFEANASFNLLHTVIPDPVHGAPATFNPALPAPNPASVQQGATVNRSAPLTTTETTSTAGLIGTWAFRDNAGNNNAWTASTALYFPYGGNNFTMPGQSVTFTGNWVFSPNASFNVSYFVTGDEPLAFSPSIPATESRQSGATVTVAGGLTADVNTKNGLIGTWTFNGWTRDGNAAASGSTFTMPSDNVVLIGSWTFQLAGAQNVNYQVTGALAPATYTPADITTLNHSAQPGEVVTVAAIPTTNETTNAAGLVGTWTFNGWTRDGNAAAPGSTFTMPEADVTLTGYWTFQLAGAQNVNYQVTGALAPATYTPADITTLNHSAQPGEVVTVAAIPTTNETTNAAGLVGTWTFNGWTRDGNAAAPGSTFTMPEADVTFTGTWTFQLADEREVTYVVNEDATYGMPASATVTPAVPGPEYVAPGATHTRIANLETTATEAICGTLGKWVFSGWTANPVVTVAADGSFTMPNADVTFTGSWGFMPNNSYNVIYSVNGVAPANYTPYVPEKESKQHGVNVEVAPNLTTTATTNAAGQRGTWTFNGWEVTGSYSAWKHYGETFEPGDTFTMPEHDVEFTGTWTFTRTGGGDSGRQPDRVVDPPETPLGPFVEDHIWYVRGFPDGSFRPGNSITRAEITMIVFRLIDSANKYTPRAGGAFSDVSSQRWYGQAVHYLASRGIVHGYPDGTFRPNEAITRAELTAVMSRFFELSDGATHSFTDVNDNHWAIRYIINAVNRGWVIGFDDNTFRPDNATTRAEAVTLINRVLARRPNPVTIRDKLYPHIDYYFDMQTLFNDITSSHWAYYDIMEAAVEHLYTLDENGLEIWSELYIPWLEGRVPFNH